MTDNSKPIIYSCSGCSSLARIAHDIALTIDGDGMADMSCISGVIGKVAPIEAVAYSGRPIIAIDGCSMGCTKSCLDACDLKADHYFDISDLGFDKRDKWDDSLTENSIALTTIYQKLADVGISAPKFKR